MIEPAAQAPGLMRPRLRIAVVTETYPPEVNGVAMTLSHMVEGLLARGHEVDLVRPRQAGESTPAPRGLLRQALVGGLPIPRYPELKLGLPSIGRLRRLWLARPPDIVHLVTEGPLGAGALCVARRLRIPVSSDFHTRFDRYSSHYGIGLLAGLVGAYLKAFHRHTRCTFVPTRELADFLAASGFGELAVIARGVDTTLFAPQRRDAALRREWGACAEETVALFVGRLAPEKNLPLVLAAFAALRERAPSARLVLVGDGPLRRDLQSRNPDVVFAGMRQGVDLARHYASADLFLFPSTTETFGNVILEALASGLPVVAYDYAAGREHIAHGTAGLLAPLDDADAFCRQSADLGTGGRDLPAMGRAARQAAEPMDWAGVNERFSLALETLAHAEKLPRHW